MLCLLIYFFISLSKQEKLFYSNSSLAHESSAINSYTKYSSQPLTQPLAQPLAQPLTQPLTQPLNDIHGNSLILESIPHSLIDFDIDHEKMVEYSFVKPSTSQDYSNVKNPKVTLPVAQEILFSEDGKYVPIERDNKNIIKNYLKKNVYLSNCHNDMINKKSKIVEIDLRKPIVYADSAVKWYVEQIKNDPSSKGFKIQSSLIQAKFLEFVSQYIISKKCLNKYDAVMKLQTIDVRKLLISKYDDTSCSSISTMNCDISEKYRTVDASCNNLAKPTWGKSNTCHQRLLQSDYADGIEVPRVAKDGSELPNARFLSTYLLPHIPISDNKLTSMTMAWGQFIVHDIARTLPLSLDTQCCPVHTAKHPECLPIYPLTQNDFLTRTYNQTCFNFIRSTFCNSCKLGPREQMNSATHVFDLSQVYGPVINDTLKLRRFQQGKLASFLDLNHDEILRPAENQKGCNISPKQPKFPCFLSGDGIRASQHPALQSLHTVFHRRHNQHAQALSMVNPHWDDEKLFQEARRITIAESTKITYGEYLPAIMGKSLTNHFGLDLLDDGYSNYDPAANPSTFQEYIVAAGRFGHSQINDVFRVLIKDNSYSYLLRDAFFETSSIHFGHTAGIIKGLVQDSTNSIDPFFVPDVKNYLYKLRREHFGRDLPAFNIMRGREHGVPGYTNYLQYCFGYKVKGWEDLLTFIPKKQLDKIKTFYKHWGDIDLFIGGVSERKFDKAAFGPTFACINGIQFHHFKFGDRFYFEHGSQAGSFTLAQLNNLRRRTSLANVLCKTTNIDYIQTNVFFLPSHHNAKLPCDMFIDLDYSLWAETSLK